MVKSSFQNGWLHQSFFPSSLPLATLEINLQVFHGKPSTTWDAIRGIWCTVAGCKQKNSWNVFGSNLFAKFFNQMISTRSFAHLACFAFRLFILSNARSIFFVYYFCNFFCFVFCSTAAKLRSWLTFRIHWHAGWGGKFISWN